jgi:capsule polysaccharide export protein KpsE/RkpR
MPDPWAAADLASAATEVLMQELTNYEIRKTEDQIRFLENQYDEIFDRFDKAQRNLIAFSDRSMGVVSSVVQIEAQRVQSEYGRASARYTALITELDRAKSRLNEETPLFTELDPVRVPHQPSAPNRERTIFVWTFLGLFMSGSFITGRHLLVKMNQQV